MKMARACMVVVLVLPAGLAWAEDAEEKRKDWNISLGAGVVSLPEYPGSGSNETRALPLVNVRYKRFFLGGAPGSGSPAGLGAYLYEDRSWNIGVVVSGDVQKPREESDDARLRGLGDIDGTARAGLFASYRVYLCVMARNTDLVKAEDAPKGYRDLLDPKWAGKIVKAHPSYSGTILTATYQTARDVGWDYYEKLAKQRVMQVQSASDPPKKLALGERAIMADGIEYGAFQLKETGKPVDVIYPVEGSPLIIGPNGILKSAPNPNAARLLQSFMLSAECQQFNVEFGGLRTAHALVKDAPGRKPMKDIKIMKDDAAAVERDSEEIKKRYVQHFKV